MEPWAWGLYTIVMTGFFCYGLWDILSAREQDAQNRYYWNKRDAELRNVRR